MPISFLIRTLAASSLALLACRAGVPNLKGAVPSLAKLPPDASFNREAGRKEPLYLMLNSRGGEAWQFFVDTGSPHTILDKSLEPKLGRMIRREKAGYAWFGTAELSVYAAPKLFLSAMQLRTGKNVRTDDFTRILPGRTAIGILGLDCLRNYCFQLDFGTGTIHFLDPDHPGTGDRGRAYPLTMSGGAVFMEGDFMGAGKAKYQIDTGCTVDGVMESALFQKAVRQKAPISTVLLKSPAGAVVRHSSFARGTLDSRTYSGFVVDGANINLLGLRFLARHRVTLNFPKRVMYLRKL